MAQDPSPPPHDVADVLSYSDQEQHALSLAAELRTQVQRERATIANLRAYLTRRDPRH